VGNYYELIGSVVTKCYYGGSQRIAMRVGGTLSSLISDHLGSTSLSTDVNGTVTSEQRYTACPLRFALGGPRRASAGIYAFANAGRQMRIRPCGITKMETHGRLGKIGLVGLCYNKNIIMPDFEFSNHAIDMLAERNIPEDWIWRTLNHPDKKDLGKDGNMHYTKAIKERKEHILHIVVNQNVRPNRIVPFSLIVD
jgi:Domain of unknown function (DUF4258)